MNVMGELMDLQAGGMVPETLDPAEVGPDFRRRYEHLWMTLTDAVTVSTSDRYQIHTLLRTLNGLGFDVAELSADSTDGGSSIRVQPKVVDAGHHRRRMMHLTGLEMHENQARRLLNDIDSYRYVAGLDHDEHAAARRWVTDVYDGVLQRIPDDLRGKFEGPELVHEVLAHRWFTSERSGTDVGLEAATDDYVATILREQARRGSRPRPTGRRPGRLRRRGCRSAVSGGPPGTAAHPSCRGPDPGYVGSGPSAKAQRRTSPNRAPQASSSCRAPGMTRLTSRSGGRTELATAAVVSARFSTTRSG